MSTFLPTGYSRWVPTFTLDGSVKIFQTVFMINNGATNTPEAMDALMRTAACGAGAPFVASNMFVGYTLARTECWMHLGTDTLYALNETPIIGTKAGSTGVPINSSTMVKKNTGLSGRKYRGRWMLPGLTVGEGNVSQAGIIDSTGLATLQGQWNTLMSNIASAMRTLYLGHTSSEVAPSAITSVSAVPKLGSQPHRIR